MYSMISTTVSKNGGTTASPFTSTDYISASTKSRNRDYIKITIYMKEQTISIDGR